MYSGETRIYHAVISIALLLCLLVVSFITVIIIIHAGKVKRNLGAVKEGINTLEKERSRIAADLHDDLSASLSAIKLQLQLIDIGDQQQQLILNRSGKYIDEAVKKLKAIALNLMPRLLEQQGLCTALNELIEMLINRAVVKVHFHCGINPADPGQSLHIYRIVQEIITNIQKHAQATVIYISIRKIKKDIRLTITDNGIGFNKPVVRQGGSGLGLQNIRSRVSVLNARLSLKTKPGSGTAYNIRIPCK